jgi:hypothetical protein
MQIGDIMCDCKIDILKDAVRKGRAYYVCPNCGQDITLLLVFAYKIKEEEDLKRVKNKKHKSKS